MDAIKNLLFPNRNICLICREDSDYVEKYICSHCRDNLEVLNKSFLTYSPYIEDAYYSLFYNRFIREVIKDYKYNGKNYLYKALGEIMIDTLNGLDINIDRVSYIPMHKRKEAVRGYNQARLLAKYISSKLQIPLIDDNLIKHKITKEQSHSNKLERSTNLKDSFRIKDSTQIKNTHILLIDDIITTGATMEEAGKILKENGANKIIGLALTSSKID